MSRRNDTYTVLRSENGIDVVLLRGEIDHHEGVPRLERTLAKLMARKSTMVLLDFRDVTYCCSGSIALILDASDELAALGGVFGFSHELVGVSLQLGKLTLQFRTKFNFFTIFLDLSLQ